MKAKPEIHEFNLQHHPVKWKWVHNIENAHLRKKVKKIKIHRFIVCKHLRICIRDIKKIFEKIRYYMTKCCYKTCKTFLRRNINISEINTHTTHTHTFIVLKTFTLNRKYVSFIRVGFSNESSTNENVA